MKEEAAGGLAGELAELERAAAEAAAELAALQRGASAAAERVEADTKREDLNRRQANYIDNLDFSKPGGVLRQNKGPMTLQELQEGAKVTSPQIKAREALVSVQDEVGALDLPEALALLSDTIDGAKAVGLRETLPEVKQAKALFSTLSASATQFSATSVGLDTGNGERSEFDQKLDAVFGGGYAFPSLDDLDD